MSPRFRLVILLFSFALLGMSIATVGYYQFYLLEYREVPMDFEIRDHEVGFNTDTDALHFGHIPPGGEGWRHMLITPAHDARLEIRFSGTAAPFLRLNESTFDAIEGEMLNITFYADIPQNVTLGPYNGTAHFYFYRW